MKTSYPQFADVHTPHSSSRRRFLTQLLIGAAGITLAEFLSPIVVSDAADVKGPQGKGVSPGVILLQNWQGVDNATRQTADRLAALGLMVVVPDLFEGKVAHSPDEARGLMQTMDPMRALTTLHDAVNYLAGSSSKIGIITSEFNSRYAVALAQRTLQIGGILVFNGIHASPDSFEADTATEAELHRYHPFDYPIVNASPRPVDGVSVRDWAPMLVLNPFTGNTSPDAFAAQLEHGVGWLRRAIAV